MMTMFNIIINIILIIIVSREDDKLSPSTVMFKVNSLSTLGRIILKLLRTLRVVHVKSVEHENDHLEMNNLTIINLSLVIFGKSSAHSRGGGTRDTYTITYTYIHMFILSPYALHYYILFRLNSRSIE